MGNRTKDLFIFLFFVVICGVFWFVQALGDTFTMEVTVPVKLDNVPRGVILTTELPKQLKLSIHDRGAEIIPLFINRQLDTLHIDFSNYDTHEPTGYGVLLLSQLQPALKKILPAEASIQSMSPDTLIFYYNRGVHRSFPVRLKGNIDARSQYCVSGLHFSPDTVDVYAPLSMLDTMHAVYTEPLMLVDQDKSFSKKIALASRRGMRIFPDSVLIKAEVDILTRQTAEVPVEGINFPADKALRTFPSYLRVTYLAPSALANAIKQEDFVIVISYAELLENESGKCTPHITSQPDGVSGVHIDPIEVDFLIENIETKPESRPAR